MAITTRNAKDWLEATLLDDDTMGGATPSDTDVASQESIKVYVDNQDATTLASAEAYADQAELDAVSTATAYTDSSVSGLATEAYADQAEADAISTANAYTDSSVSGLATEAYADQAEADAISTANAYTDSQISTNGGPMSDLPVTLIDNTDSPYAASFGEVIIADSSTASVTVTLPQLSGQLGKQITVYAYNTTNSVNVTPNGADSILGLASIDIGSVIGAGYPLTLVASGDGTNGFWAPFNVSQGILTGYAGTDRSYTELIRVLNTNTTGTVYFGQDLTGTADGFTFSGGADPMVTDCYSTDGSAYIMASCQSASDTAQIKLRHIGANNEWRVTSAGTNNDFFIRSVYGGVAQTMSLYADAVTGNIGLHKNAASNTSPISMTTSLPVYADNTAATGGGLAAGDVYRTATGDLKIVY